MLQSPSCQHPDKQSSIMFRYPQYPSHGASMAHSFSARQVYTSSIHSQRALHEFQRPKEAIRAIRDAIAVQKETYISTGKTHGCVSIDTIYIGAPHYAPKFQGFLVQPSVRTAEDSTFKSVRALSSILHRQQFLSLDYLDDLESFYYVVVWICYTYDGSPGGRPVCIPLDARVPLLNSLAAYPTTRETVLEKEAMLFGNGIVFDNNPISEYWGGELMEELLDNLHYILTMRYRQKLDLRRPRSMNELRSDAIRDYDAFMQIISDMLFKWEHR